MKAKAVNHPNRRQKLGSTGEKLAAAHLTAQGYRIIATNWRCRIGELDIVAWHEQCLAFIEVRTRHGRTAGTPEESITPHKKQRLLNLVDAFLQAEPGLLALSGELPPCRIDVVAVEFEATGELSRLEVIENAIQAE